jgi:hypothetical protein
VELLLNVGVLQLRVKENARLARVRLFRIDEDKVKPARAARKSTSAKFVKSKRK